MTPEETKQEKNLWVAISEDGREVVINQIAPPVDAEGWTHMVFSVEQARNLAWLLFRKANVIEGIECAHCNRPITQETGWATAMFRYCFREECQQEFYKEAQAIIRKVNPEVADKLAKATTHTQQKIIETTRRSAERFAGIYRDHFPQSERPLTDKESLPASFECPRCHRVSYNRNDVANRYCGACNLFFGDLEIGLHR